MKSLKNGRARAYISKGSIQKEHRPPLTKGREERETSKTKNPHPSIFDPGGDYLRIMQIFIGKKGGKCSCNGERRHSSEAKKMLCLIFIARSVFRSRGRPPKVRSVPILLRPRAG